MQPKLDKNPMLGPSRTGENLYPNMRQNSYLGPKIGKKLKWSGTRTGKKLYPKMRQNSYLGPKLDKKLKWSGSQESVPSKQDFETQPTENFSLFQ